jgi:hypothetical protein
MKKAKKHWFLSVFRLEILSLRISGNELTSRAGGCKTVSGAHLGLLGSQLESLGAHWGRLGVHLGRLGAHLGRLGAHLERLETKKLLKPWFL